MKTWEHWGKSVRMSSAAVVLAAALLSGGAGVYADASPAGGTLPAVIQKTTSSVVAIIGKPGDGSKKVYEANRYRLAHGTGVIVRSDGYILTNAHVVKNMRNLTIVTSDGKSFTGKTTHYDEESDLALVKIEAAGLTPATFASPSDIKVGEAVMAIGTPLSFALRNSVTSGIVSGMERTVQSKYQLIQTDAAINPGNSGGALVNMKGEVIGINTMKYVEYGVDSLGFAIPVDTVQYVLDQFFKYGKVKRPSLGLELGESWEAVVGLPSGNGLEVTYVQPDSPSSQAGIKQGDLLLSIDAAKTHNLVEYNEALKKYLPGQKVRLTLQSDGKTKELDVTLGEDAAAQSGVTQDADGSYIDADQGKTLIGDSHYGWSIKYPAGLVKTNQSATGDNVVFADAKGEFAVNIRIQEKVSRDLSPLGLLKKLNTRGGDTILEKRYIDAGPLPYAKLAGERTGGGYYETRAFLKDDKIYYVTLALSSEEGANTVSKKNSFMDLLDSFTLKFDAANTALKDISAYQDKNTVTTPYGLAFDLPDEWRKKEYGEGFVYTNKDGDQSVTVRVSSAASGDTLKDWAARQEKKIKDTYVDGYREIQGSKDTTAVGMPAIENRYATTMGDKWKQSYVLYLLKDKYKYEVKVSYPKSSADDADSMLSALTSSIRFSKEAVNRSLGIIQDEDDLAYMSKNVTYTSQKYRYSVWIPETWGSGGAYDGETDSASKSFSFEGGSLSISADDRSSLGEVWSKSEKDYKKNAENDAAYQYQATDESLFDTSVKKVAVQYKTKNVPYTLNEYTFAKNGIVYTVRSRINDAVKTEEQWERLNSAVQSMKFTEK
ncbi:trypsin-like peptidase domain-containing protein [Paenibacillus filicis]|uniref:Trypsin-like peptidase domain-containing protein n=1 Tax=Paenibacillus gyeongsangnamensis TaxID=3388067 RepID=A0ABT4Q760_9BACL|nr:trypsin-like peptidase domain-containing protein [Paenibacillus filicis]MCZ8512711.1 trypsin-like peptidase domain-containing protein [Paenibacillus filicis]